MERATQERLVGATLLILSGVILIPWLLDGRMNGPEVTQQELVLPGGNDSGNETRRIILDAPRPDAPAPAGSTREIDARSVREADRDSPAMSLPTPEEAPATSTSVAPARFARPMPEKATTPAATAAETSSAPAPSNPPRVMESEPQQTPARGEASSSTASGAPKDPIQTASQETASLANSAPTTPPDAPASPAVNAQPSSPGEEAWAVQVGSFASQENAERLAERLRGKSYKAFVMRNVVDGRVRFRVRVGPVSQRSEAELLATALREDRQPARVLSHP